MLAVNESACRMHTSSSTPLLLPCTPLVSLIRYELLDSMAPWMGGGEMIADVFLDHSTYADPPLRFEAGTPAIAEAIGLGAACDYLASIGMHNVHTFEQVCIHSIPSLVFHNPCRQIMHTLLQPMQSMPHQATHRRRSVPTCMTVWQPWTTW